MGKVIDLASKRVQEEKIYWDIDIDEGTNERMSIVRNPANEQIMIYISTFSFERIFPMKEKALAELKQRILKNEIEYV